MAIAKRIIVWAIVLAGVIVLAINFGTIRDKVVGFNQNAAYLREAKEAGSKFKSEIFSNWTYEALLPCLDESVKDEWSKPEKSQLFGAWNTTYGSVTSSRNGTKLVSGKGSEMNFEFRSEMQCANKNALLLLKMRRKSATEWTILDISVSDLPGSASSSQ